MEVFFSFILASSTEFRWNLAFLIPDLFQSMESSMERLVDPVSISTDVKILQALDSLSSPLLVDLFGARKRQLSSTRIEHSYSEVLGILVSKVVQNMYQSLHVKQSLSLSLDRSSVDIRKGYYYYDKNVGE